MTRLLSFFAALVLAGVAVSSACVAGPVSLLAASSTLTFKLQPARTSDKIRASFEMDRRGDRDDTDWSTSFAAAEFAGLDLGQLRGRGNGPVAFSLTREAGRLDCSGNGGGGYANGSCRFTPNAVFSNLSDFEGGDPGEDFDLLESLETQEGSMGALSAADEVSRVQVLAAIEQEVAALPARQREAFLLRYWEELDVAETAAVMGCSEGSVKTHCSRAVHALAKTLKANGISL